jgi:hypothetical protein
VEAMVVAVAVKAAVEEAAAKVAVSAVPTVLDPAEVAVAVKVVVVVVAVKAAAVVVAAAMAAVIDSSARLMILGQLTQTKPCTAGLFHALLTVKPWAAMGAPLQKLAYQGWRVRVPCTRPFSKYSPVLVLKSMVCAVNTSRSRVI